MNLIFRTADDLIFNLTGANRTAGFFDTAAQIDMERIERSFGPGAIIPGEKRIRSSNLAIRLDLNYPDDDQFRAAFNEILYWARAARWIEDTDAEVRTRVSFTGKENTMDRGGMIRGSVVVLNFAQETPYWEDVDYTEILNGTGASFSVAATNAGWLAAPARIEITASALTPWFRVYVGENSEGIEITDLTFGNLGFTDYIIDCENGTAKLNGLLRNDRIVGSSGFFDFPVGAFTLNLDAAASVAAVVKYRRRLFL